MKRAPVASPATDAPYVDPELYDLAYSWYDADLAYYVEHARAANGPVLEAACGTGRVLLPTRAAGVDIDGFDLEPAMIGRLAQVAAARGLAVRAWVADLRSVVTERRYALVTIPFRAFMHLLDTEDQLAALRALRGTLAPGGALRFNVFYPAFARMAEREGRRICERTFHDSNSGRDVELWDETRYDRVAQTFHVERDVVVNEPDRRERDTRHYAFTLRWTYRYEMELLLRAAGFARWEVRGGFDGRPLERDTDEMVWTAWRDA